MNLKNTCKLIFVVCIFGALAGCQQRMSPTPFVQSPTPGQFPSATLSATNSPLLTTTPAIPTVTPAIHYQLTFVSKCQEEFRCMYAIDVGCLGSEQPCFGDPQLLFEISKAGQGPMPPVLSYSWSPDGQQIAIESTGLRGKGDVFVGNWAGLNWINLTNSPNYEGDPAWSPDGRWIAYSANSGDPDHFVRVFSITPDGKGAVQLLSFTDSWYIDAFSFSPDGKQVAFVHNDDMGYGQIFITNPNGSNLKQLTDQPADHYSPAFSPDWRWIVFTRELERGSAISNLFLIHPDGTGEFALTQNASSWLADPVWSPIGNWIAFTSIDFTSGVEGNYDIYLIRSDGTGLMKITQSNEDEFAPAWRIVSP